MKLETFLEKFDQFADVPEAVAKMRELVLDLAVQGKLVEPKPSEGDGHSPLIRLSILPPERNSKSRSPKDIAVEPEIPLEIPRHWALTTVENTTRETGFFCDGDWVESKDQDPDGDVRLIQLADVGDGEFRDRSSRFMTRAAAKRLSCSYLEAGDILVARMPDPLGRCCRFPGDSKPAVTVVDVCILRPNVTFFDPDFLVIAINCPRFRRLVSAQATGTTRSRISRSNLGVLPIPLPPLAEQKRIVAKVNELMALCDRMEALQQERETRHAALARASLSRFADAPTRANLAFLFHPSYAIAPGDLRKAVLTLAVQGKLSRSEEARHALLGDVIDLISGQHLLAHEHNEDGRGIPYLTGPSDFGTMYPVPSRWTESPKVVAEPGDILVTVKGSGVGKTNKLVSERTAISRQLMAVRPRAVDADFVHLVLMNASDHFQKSMTGIAIPGIGRKDVLELEVDLPSLAEQRRIVSKVGQLMALVNALETQLAASRATAANFLSAFVAELTGAARDGKGVIASTSVKAWKSRSKQSGHEVTQSCD